jgi:hypothetical protein
MKEATEMGRSRDFQGPLMDLGTIVTMHGGGWMLLRLEGAVERWVGSRERGGVSRYSQRGRRIVEDNGHLE